MAGYLIRRLLLALVTLAGVCLITVLLVRITGDPARFVLGEMATEDAIAQFRVRHGLDQPMHVQFTSFIGGIVRGNLGVSVRYNQPVLKLIAERIPATLELGVAAYALAVVVGIGVGVYSAVRVGSVGDKVARFAVLFGQAVPGFYLGILLIIVVAAGTGWFPTGGRQGLRSLVLPALTLGAYLTAVVLRLTRSAMLDVLGQDYVRTARAKGLSEKVVIYRHALRNALIPLITILGVQSRVVFAGAIVTETVFSWPGVGRLAVHSIMTRDFPIIQGTVFIVTCMVVVSNLFVDLVYGYVDPRIRLAGK